MTSRKLFDSKRRSTEMTSTPANGTTPTEKISYRLAHAITGRMRFCIPRLAKDSEYADKLKALIESDSKIKDVRINPYAASIVINYQPDKISADQMRSHLVNLIQAAPNTVEPKQATARSILAAIFDAVVNLIDSIRNVNKVRKGVTHQGFKTDGWERTLSTVKDMTKGLKSATMFVLPKRSPTDNVSTEDSRSVAVSNQQSVATNNGRQS